MADTESRISKFVFRVPYSNPMYFGKVQGSGYEYRVWDDSMDNEFSRNYVQKWKTSDILSFQFNWENFYNPSKNLTVRFYVNGALAKTNTYSASSAGTQGYLYSEFVISSSNGTKFNGCYCFSKKISEILVGSTQIITNGDCFYIEVVDMADVTWRSNTMLCTSDVENTKLIHYSNTCAKVQTVYDTYFGYMINGFDVRIDSSYTEITPASDTEFIETYEGGMEMISSIPYETVKMRICDNGVMMPRYYLRLFNIIMCCDRKSIDGYDVELNGEGLSVERIVGYANDVYEVVIRRKANGHSYESTGSNVTVQVYVDQISEPSSKSAKARLTIVSDVDWYIDYTSPTVEYSRVSGGAGTTYIDVRMPKNTGSGDVTITTIFRSPDDNTLLASASILNRKVAAGGIGSMKLGDTFIIR